ncbi:PKD domain-containing protein [Halovenus sp. HT40]|uniref:PKD domain-containing protein n=1 Tax=Halovenus sp. HT40 TaxID=3126691 RepID=UPI00300EAF6D
MIDRIVGAFLATCLFVSLCGLITPVAGAPMQDGQLEDDAESVVPAVEERNRSADRPFAEAGLDRTVSVGETVYLDAYGSRAAAGTLTAYEWRIERPDGTTTTPACSTCELTQFRPTEPGQYNVTVTVEDEAGRIASDTLYVTVLDQPAPNATLSGPDEINLNDTARIDLNASASAGELAAVEWYVDGDYREGQFLETDSFEDTLEFSPDTVGKHTISAVVRNDNGTARRVRHELVAREIASFEVEITDAAETVEAGQYWAPEFEVTNTDSITDTQEISLSISGGPSTVDSETITLDPGETQTFDDSIWGPPMLAWFTSESDDGPFTATVASETSNDTTTAEVLQPAYFDIEIIDTEVFTIRTPSGESESLSIDLRVTNTGEQTKRGNPLYTFDPDETLAWEHTAAGYITLDPGESRTIDFSSGLYEPSDDTLYTRTEDDRETQRIGGSGGGGNGGDSSSSSSGCDAPDNCIVYEVSVENTDMLSGEYRNFGRVTIAKSPEEAYSQTEWITMSDEDHPYAASPDHMTGSSPGSTVGAEDKGDVKTSGNFVSGYEADSGTLGEAWINIGDNIGGSGVVKLQITRGGDGDGGGGGGGGGEKPGG